MKDRSRYRVEGDDLITTVDVSWNEEWNATEQRRHDRIGIRESSRGTPRRFSAVFQKQILKNWTSASNTERPMMWHAAARRCMVVAAIAVWWELN
jgi:hypothetical protein